MKYIKTINRFLNESILNIGDNNQKIKDILNFKYQNMRHIYTEQSQSDDYTMEVTNWDNSYYNEVGSDITSIFLTSGNELIEELKWYEENSSLEFLNDYSYDKLVELGLGVELITFIGDDDINKYFTLFKNKCNFIWGQYFTDSEKIDMSKAIARTQYNNREIIIVLKKEF